MVMNDLLDIIDRLDHLKRSHVLQEPIQTLRELEHFQLANLDLQIHIMIRLDKRDEKHEEVLLPLQ